MLTQTGNKPVTKSRLVKVETFFAIMTLPIIMYRKNLTAQQCAILYKLLNAHTTWETKSYTSSRMERKGDNIKHDSGQFLLLAIIGYSTWGAISLFFSILYNSPKRTMIIRRQSNITPLFTDTRTYLP